MKRALVFGLNYKDTGYQLSCCENDALEISARMNNCKVQTRVIMDEDNIGIEELESLLLDYAKKQKLFDTFYFFYSGHGSQIPGNEEDGYDETLCLFKDGYIDLFSDNRLRNILNKFKGQVVVIFDSCFSGDMEKNTAPNRRKFVPYDILNLNPNQPKNVKATLEAANSLKVKMNFVFASGGSEYSYEGDDLGMFTGSLIKHWDSGKKYITQLMPLITQDVQHLQHPVHKTINTKGLKKLF